LPAVDLKTCTLLAELNRAFYAAFAGEFARTRRGWPPGFEHILSYLPVGANVLDLGCGNGRLLAFLAGRGWRGRYVGVDNDPQLRSLAREVALNHPAIQAAFVQADLTQPGWPVRIAGEHPDRVVCLAALHHIPGRANREHLLQDCVALLPAGGILILSTWQFMSSGRLRAKILSWDTIGLDAGDVETGDYLLSWGGGAAGLRYCASIDPPELQALAAGAGLTLVDSFLSDGKEGNLNLYGIFGKRET
jgi:tRNA (uracil-5-)-methyltransferase TRM9